MLIVTQRDIGNNVPFVYCLEVNNMVLPIMDYNPTTGVRITDKSSYVAIDDQLFAPLNLVSDVCGFSKPLHCYINAANYFGLDSQPNGMLADGDVRLYKQGDEVLLFNNAAFCSFRNAPCFKYAWCGKDWYDFEYQLRYHQERLFLTRYVINVNGTCLLPLNIALNQLGLSLNSFRLHKAHDIYVVPENGTGEGVKFLMKNIYGPYGFRNENEVSVCMEWPVTATYTNYINGDGLLELARYLRAQVSNFSCKAEHYDRCIDVGKMMNYGVITNRKISLDTL